MIAAPQVVPQQLDVVALEQKVRTMYRDVATKPFADYHFEMGRALAERLGYARADLDAIPREAIDSFAGVGYYFDLAALRSGEKVVDLGSGSGTDAFIARLKVGESGAVNGIDMTDKQLAKSRHLRDAANLQNVFFRDAYIELTGLKSNDYDVVVSNGVVNLAADKTRVFSEAVRLLKTGGRLAIADIVTEVPLPEDITRDATLWAACIGGALQIDDYLAAIEAAGLNVQTVRDNVSYRFISDNAQGAAKKFGVKSVSILAVK
jgi:SAM-dependent methyltransferase